VESKSTGSTHQRAPLGLGGVESDLAAQLLDQGARLWMEQTIAPGFEQAEGEILQ